MVHRKIVSAFMALLLVFTLTGTAFAAPVEYGEELQNMPQNTPSVSFTDLPNTHWAYKYIADMVNRKVLEGYPDNKFRPDKTISRAEFATIIVKAAGLQPKKVNYSSFSDVKVTDWYSPWIEAAKDYLTGYRTANGEYIYNPTAPALREDITVAIVKLKGYDVARLANRSVIEAMFKDYEGISESAKDYVAIAVEHGLVSGYPDETFRPQNSITRAEAAALLWRAFMYGNDNKGVGGEEQATPITPTPAVTQPDTTPTGITPTVPQTPTQPQQPNQPAKFSVDTLVGGTGQGDVDGPVYVAKINQVDSMVVDKDNNVYFLDARLKKVRKFDHSNGTVSTFRQVDSSFDGNYEADGNVTHISHNYFFPKKLAYSHTNNGLYLLGYAINVYSSMPKEYYAEIFELTPAVKLAAYNKYNEHRFDLGDTMYRFFRINNHNEFIYGIGEDDERYPYDEAYKNSNIYKATMNAQAELIGSSKDNTSVSFSRAILREHDSLVDVISTDNRLYVFDGDNKQLTRIQLFPRKVESVISFANMHFDSVTVQNDKFYLSSGTTIYELSLDGKLTTFIDGKDLTYNDGNPIQKIKHMAFDSNGNLVVYDDDNKAIRRINL